LIKPGCCTECPNRSRRVWKFIKSDMYIHIMVHGKNTAKLPVSFRRESSDSPGCKQTADTEEKFS
jgi:hypothetical protein